MPIATPTERQALDPEVLLGQFSVERVLYEAEIPVIFVMNTALGQSLLAYTAEELEDGAWLVLAPCGHAAIADLIDGRLPVRDALTGSWMWLARKVGESVTQMWAIEPTDLPDEHLPYPGTMLLPEKEPVLTAKAIGPSISRGTVAASVIGFLAGAMRAAIKTVLDHLQERGAVRRSSKEIRALCDLPVQRFSFGSFEVSFAAPPGLAQDLTLLRAVELLCKGLAWAASDGESPFEAESDDGRSAILQAVNALTPPTVGSIEQIVIGGQWSRRGPLHLDRGSRRRVRNELRKARTEHVVLRKGRIGELDRDNCSFILRDIPGAPDSKAVFSEEQLDDILDYFTRGERVVVIGVERNGRMHTAAVTAEDRSNTVPSEG
ncbi:MAG: hypothetical protein V2A73_03760 [Pseudomonadota bacterium]